MKKCERLGRCAIYEETIMEKRQRFKFASESRLRYCGYDYCRWSVLGLHSHITKDTQLSVVCVCVCVCVMCKDFVLTVNHKRVSGFGVFYLHACPDSIHSLSF